MSHLQLYNVWSSKKLHRELESCCIQNKTHSVNDDGHKPAVAWDTCLVLALQKEVTAVLLEGDKGGHQLEGVAMKGTIAKRFEELDWDNNGGLNDVLLETHCC